jgi:hypothetical protein
VRPRREVAPRQEPSPRRRRSTWPGPTGGVRVNRIVNRMSDGGFPTPTPRVNTRTVYPTPDVQFLAELLERVEASDVTQPLARNVWRYHGEASSQTDRLVLIYLAGC